MIQLCGGGSRSGCVDVLVDGDWLACPRIFEVDEQWCDRGVRDVPSRQELHSDRVRANLWRVGVLGYFCIFYFDFHKEGPNREKVLISRSPFFRNPPCAQKSPSRPKRRPQRRPNLGLG